MMKSDDVTLRQQYAMVVLGSMALKCVVDTVEEKLDAEREAKNLAFLCFKIADAMIAYEEGEK